METVVCIVFRDSFFLVQMLCINCYFIFFKFTKLGMHASIILLMIELTLNVQKYCAFFSCQYVDVALL